MPICNTCGVHLHDSISEPGVFECGNQRCGEYGLTQSVNEAIQPDSAPVEQDDVLSIEPKQAVKGKTGADTIKARESVYGPFAVHAKAEQEMKLAMTSQPGWTNLNDVQKSAAEMIVHKLARILNKSANYADNWHDIAGYATLAEQDIENSASKTET